MMTIRETLDMVGRPAPRALIEVLKDKGGAAYISWYDRCDLMDERAPGWKFEILREGQMPAMRLRETGEMTTNKYGKTVPVKALFEVMLTYAVARVTIECEDGTIVREATGTDDDPEGQYGTPLDRAQASALGRATSMCGLGRELYEGAGTPIRMARIQARRGNPTLSTEDKIMEKMIDAKPAPGRAAERIMEEGLDQPDPEQDDRRKEEEQAIDKIIDAELAEEGGSMGSDNADMPVPAAPPNGGLAAWEPESWKAEAEALVADGKFMAIAGPTGLLSLAQTGGPLGTGIAPEVKKATGEKTFYRYEQVVKLLMTAACQVVADRCKDWTDTQRVVARDIIVAYPVRTPKRKEALAAIQALGKPAVPNKGDHPDDWDKEVHADPEGYAKPTEV